MKIEVYHNTFGDKDKHVATVNVDDSVEVYSALEHSYRYTNNVKVRGQSKKKSLRMAKRTAILTLM